jgi:PKD repeat protein
MTTHARVPWLILIIVLIAVHVVPVQAELNPDFTAMPRSGVSPLSVQFNDTSSGFIEPITYLWTFGDGNTSSKQNPVYIYKEPGLYTVKLDITNASGDQVTITHEDYITVEPALIPDPLNPEFTAIPRSGVAPLSVQFNDTSTGEHDQWEWNFGDGNTSSQQKPLYTYNQPGSYDVTLIISKNEGEQATILHSGYITVESPDTPEPLDPAFTGTPRSGVAPLSVQFNDTSTGPLDQWEWDFGDGNTSSLQNPRHSYTETGTYTVTLIISNISGEQATLKQNNYITINSVPEAIELIPNFTGTPRSGINPLTVQFTDTSSGFVEPVTYLWDFGDGNTSSKHNPLYTYHEPGTYTVKLDISNASGEQATLKQNNYITITSVQLVVPVADFFGIPTSGVAPLVVTFSDLSTKNPTSWNWSFGDGSLENATEQNPVHTYTNHGTYTVSLNVTNADGSDSQTRQEYITVNPAVVPLVLPVADFFGTPTSGVAPLTVTFSDISTKNPTSWRWSFGDDSAENATEQNPVHTFANPGTYTVELNATNADGSDTQTREEYITVIPAVVPLVLPVADFFGIPTSGSAPLTVAFSDLSTNTISWNWTFGDYSVENATKQNPVHTFANPGAYTVSLNATNADGSDTQTREKYITVNLAAVPLVLPVADFFGTPTSGSASLTVTFSDLSSNTTSWNWSFGDDSTENATDQNPVHTYNNPGTYTVSLNAINTDGKDTQTRKEYITVNPAEVALLPIADFSGDPVNGTAPLTVTFTDLSKNTPDSWNWSFGDDSLDNITEKNPIHTYYNPGNYSVSLNATNADGSDTKIVTGFITVSAAPLEPLIPEPLISSFTGTPTSGPAPLIVQFNDISTGLHDQWEWNFGNGNTSSEQNPFYIYNEPGSYSIILNVSQAGGDSVSSTQDDFITVVTPLIQVPLNATPLISNFTGIPVSGPAPLTVQFNDTSTGPHDMCEWNFGNGNTSSEQNPLYIYNEPGSYSITLNVSQAGRDSVSSTQDDFITVSAVSSTPPIADFSGEPVDGVAPLTVRFTDSSINIPTTWNWSFGDDSLENTTEKNPVHIYNNPGNYTVSLNATNAAGSNVTTKTSFINITPASLGPVADFTGTPTSGFTPLTVQFNDTSTGFVNPVTYLWDFGDGFNSTERNPSHTYSASSSTNYTVTLNVSGNYGKTDSMIKSGYIFIDIPTIELIISDPLSTQSLFTGDSANSDQSIPQAQSITMGKSILQTQSLPNSVSSQNILLADTEIKVSPPQINNWLLNSGSNTKNLNMQVRSDSDWEIDVKDAMDGNKPTGTEGKMAEYNNTLSNYIDPPNGKYLNNALHVISPYGNDVELSNFSKPLQTHIILLGEKGIWIEHPIRLSQFVDGRDTSLQNTRYRIVIVFEAASGNF